MEMSINSSPYRSSKVYDKIKDGKYSYEQTRQMLMARQVQFKKKNSTDLKYDPNKRQVTDLKKLYNMIHNNNKYLNVPHG